MQQNQFSQWSVSSYVISFSSAKFGEEQLLSRLSDRTVWPTYCWTNGLSDNSFRIMLLLSSVDWKTILLWWWLFVIWPRSYSTDESNTYSLAYTSSGTPGTLSADFTSCRGICSIDFKYKINMYIQVLNLVYIYMFILHLKSIE